MKLTIEWIYRTKSGATTTFISPQMTPHEALLFAEDIEKTGRVKQLTITDEHDSTWMIKELKKYVKELETEPQQVQIFFDGNFDLGSQQAGVGIVLYYHQNNTSYRYRRNALFDYIQSNNEAEYAALSFAIDQCIELGVYQQEIEVSGDSQVVIQQMSGEWPVYEKELENWADRIDQQLASAKLKANFMHIPRSENKEADQLASQALEGTVIEATLKQ